MTKEQIFLETIEDAVADLFYYDRKNDEELSPEDVDLLIESGTVTLKMITERVTNVVQKNYPNIREE